MKLNAVLSVQWGMNPYRTHAAVLFASALLAPVAWAAEPVDSPEQAPEQAIDYAPMVARQVTPGIKAEIFPGAMVGIYKDGQTHFYPVGTLSFDLDEAPTEDTLYEIGSISKVVTGVLFADAIRRGEVTRETLVNDLLPEGYQTQSKDGEDIRLWHLTSHTSGWSTAPANLAPTDGEKPFAGFTETMLFEAAAMMPPKSKPGTAFEYSNMGVGLLGTLIAKNAGGEYESLVKQRVLKPLGLENFSIELSEAQLEDFAPAIVSGRTTKAWGKTGPMDPAGMWVTTAPGLLSFAIAGLEASKEADKAIHRSIALSQASLFDLGNGDGLGGQVCHGWFIARDGQTFWHNGMTGGYSSYMAVNQQHNTAVVMLANGAGFETTAIGEQIIQAVLGLDPEPLALEAPERLDAEYLARIEGNYHSQLGFDMTVSSTRGRLFVQLTGQQPLEVLRVTEGETKDRFRIKVVDAQIGFELPEEGNATSLTLFQNGMEMKCERTE